MENPDVNWPVFKQLLMVEACEYLKDAIPLDESRDPEYYIELSKDIEEYCKYEGKDYYESECECYKHECASEISDDIIEFGAVIALNEYNKIQLISLSEIYSNEDEFEYWNNPYRGMININFREALEDYNERYGVDYKFLGVYHTHPITIPCPSQPDVDNSCSEDTIIDGIDNSTCGIVFAIGGWCGFRTQLSENPDAILYYYPEPENSTHVEEIEVYSTDKMFKMTHENLLNNSICNPNKAYIWKQPDGTIIIYEKGEVYKGHVGILDRIITRFRERFRR